MISRRRWAMTTAGCTALLLAGCAGADDAGAGGEASPSAAADTAPAAESSCGDGVALTAEGSVDSEDIYTAVAVVRVAADGSTTMRDEWGRGEAAGAVAASGATDNQQAMVRDAVEGGLLDVAEAPQVDESEELLADVEKGTYVLYAFAERTTENVTLTCGDGSDAVDAAVTSFDEVEVGAADCASSPDPVTEYVAADAIDYCDRA
ncbi:hypothetical protein UQW22_05965 [Isoptericola halotolerans]|uniref:hypothetical protein n=1 Tax=Isoptericola halotolerans TaxID=300560 RepID=UPI00388ECA11